MGRPGRRGSGGGKQGGGGGGGRKGRKGRKGGGKGKKRKRSDGKGAEQDGEEVTSSDQEEAKAEPGTATRVCQAAAAVEPAAKVSKPSRPGFDTLLQTLGVEDSDAESGGGEESEEEEQLQVSQLQKGAAAGQADMAPEEVEDEEVEKEDQDEELESEEEGQAEVSQVDVTKAQRTIATKKGASARGSSEKLAQDLPDFYPHFWSDPPAPLADVLQFRGGARPAEGSRERHSFSLPGLGRCEARHRDVTSLLQQLQSPQDAAEVWRRCSLAPGLRERFEEWLSAQQLDIGAEEGVLFFFLHSYLDVAFPQHTHLNARTVRAVCVLHIVDHVMKATREVLTNSAKLNAQRRKGDEASEAIAPDQGFTRARVLVLCPFRSACHQLVTTFLDLVPGIKQVANRKRFDEEFGCNDEEVDDAQPPDWQHLFNGNNDDRFKVGLALSKKTVRLCTSFDKSDVIFASPLGLRMITGAEGERKREFDFLSSIEVCVIDRADVLRMQNWEHVEDVLNVVNCKPQGLQGIDISRLRSAFADGRAREFRQTVVTSAGQSMDFHALFGKGTAEAGKEARLRFGAGRGSRRGGRGSGHGSAGGRFESEDEEDEMEVGLPSALLSSSSSRTGSRSCRGVAKLCAPLLGDALRRTTALGVPRQFFLHVGSASLHEQSDRLFEAFEARYWKPLGSSLERLLVVVNSYFNFLKLRQWLRDEGASFCSAFEYSKNQDLSRARYRFFHGERRLLLVTERFLWYRRYRLKGVDYVLFYGPPETPEIYEDVISGVRTPSQCNSMCLFTKQDGFALQRIVGDERAQRMLAAPPAKVFVFS